MTLYDQLLAARNNQNAMAFLNVVADAEGTTKNGYYTQFGGGRIGSLADHPRTLHDFTETGGKKNKTSAAGRYQFTQSSWDDAAKALGLKDFSPLSQDLAALFLLQRAGGLDPVLAGDFKTGLSKAAPVWASLPGSPYAQRTRDTGFITESLARHTGGNVGNLATPQMNPNGSVVPDPGNPGAAIGAVFNEFKGLQPPSYASAIAEIQNSAVPQQQQQDAEDSAWSQNLLGLAIDDDANRARSSAVATFFGEDPIPELAIPPPIDEAINRYLARLT